MNGSNGHCSWQTWLAMAFVAIFWKPATTIDHSTILNLNHKRQHRNARRNRTQDDNIGD